MAQETLSLANEGSALRTQLEQLTQAISADMQALKNPHYIYIGQKHVISPDGGPRR